ncbi:hypothetical protein GYMLUDRAFT_734483 [Collybiopsis luxurians FD-317 M1]|nr:hypothetical protein GYMLUDRAFT_734483 [Collybiopsis luxurians FD-317 M1]
MQKEARRVHEENKALRCIIRDLGMSDDVLQQRLELVMGTSSSSACTPQNCASTASHSSIIPAPPATISNTNSTIAPSGPPSAVNQIMDRPPPATAPLIEPMSNASLTYHEDPVALDTLQTWDLYSWLNDLSNIKDAYGIEAQTQFDYDDATSLSNIPYQANNTVWAPDDPVLIDSSGTSVIDVDNTSSQETERVVSHIPGSMSDNDLLAFPLGNMMQWPSAGPAHYQTYTTANTNGFWMPAQEGEHS